MSVLGLLPVEGVFFALDQPILCQQLTLNNPKGYTFSGARRLHLSDGKPLHHFSAISSHVEFCVIEEKAAVRISDCIPMGRGLPFGLWSDDRLWCHPQRHSSAFG